MNTLPLGFIPEPLRIPLEKILPSRRTPDGVLASRKFRQIVASIEAVGLIEPLTICKVDKATGQHMLLDGHIRVLALKQLGFADAPCLVATDDESYTYNNRVNRLTTIQEHFMIRRAVERGVTPAKLAHALSVDVTNITKKLSLLDGVCAEAIELLKDQYFSAHIGAVLRKLKPIRQVECVELMVSTNNVSVGYAQALVVATPEHMLVAEKKRRKVAGITAEQIDKMEREMGNLQGKFKMVEQSYGEDVLNLVLAKGYLVKLLSNEAVARFLNQRHAELMLEFQSVVDSVSLDK